MDPRPLLVLFLAQESGPVSRSAPSLPPEVAGIVEKAARAQFPEGGGDPEVRDLSLLFEFLVRDEERSNEVSADHAFAAPDRVRTTVKDLVTGVTVTTGTDGRRYWVRDDKGTTLLEGRENRDARDEIDERVRLSRDLAAVFSVRRLAERLEGLRRLPDETADGRPLAVLEGESAAFGPVRRGGVEHVRLRLRIDSGTGDLSDILATPLSPAGDGPAPETERFRFYDFLTKDGLRLPRRITVTIGEAPRPHYEIGRIRGIRLNPGLPPETFAPPR
ncbi:MAG TPA: hypothetical protein VKF62_12905 [Planctomycetota bacterium]|nr:hypothetical protein [Planctomycetota bacterium]